MTLTYTPLPRWLDLLAGMAATNPEGSTLAAPWNTAGAHPFWYAHSTGAIGDIMRWWQQHHEGAEPTLWVPDYFCNGGLNAARDVGVNLCFYPLDEQLNPDWARCRALATDRRPDILLLVHYFGRQSDCEGARKFADSHDALLFEDCAHVLRPCGAIGNSGDFVVYSPHKFLALPAGSLLLAKPDSGFAIPDQASSPSAGAWMAKRVVQKLLPEGLLRARTRRQTLPFTEDGAGDPRPHIAGMGTLESRLLHRYAMAMDAIAKHRSANAAIYADYFANHAVGEPLVPPITAESCDPYRFVLNCTDPEAAAGLYHRLRNAGLPVETWPDLPPEVLADPVGYGDAHDRRRTFLLFPVHHGIRTQELRQLFDEHDF